MEISKDKIRAYVLKNSIAYNGKANPGAVVSALFNEGLEKDKVKDIMPKIQEIVKEVEKLSLEEQEKDFEKFSDLISEREVREGLVELPNTEKGVVMRFAPSASGPLHIGHALVYCLNLAYVRKYGGKMYFRIEDTNPENVFTEAYDLLKEDSEWLSNGEAEIMVQSERLDLYYGYAVSLVEKDSAYVCTCSGDDFREFSKKKKECPCRSKSVEENIQDWEKMIASDGFKSGEAVLRIKTPEDLGGMQHKNPAMRDFPLARINEEEHPYIKEKHKVWPLMNLSVAIDDLETGITHIIRGKDHRDNAKRQEIIYKALGFENKIPWTGFLGRLHFKDLTLSTSEFRKGIEEGKYSGWDDSKLPTIQALKKQRYKPEAFLKLAENIGLSESDKILDKKEYFYLLDNCNKL